MYNVALTLRNLKSNCDYLHKIWACFGLSAFYYGELERSMRYSTSLRIYIANVC